MQLFERQDPIETFFPMQTLGTILVTRVFLLTVKSLNNESDENEQY